MPCAFPERKQTDSELVVQGDGGKCKLCCNVRAKVFLFDLAGPVPVQLVPGADELKKNDDPLSSFSF